LRSGCSRGEVHHVSRVGQEWDKVGDMNLKPYIGISAKKLVIYLVLAFVFVVGGCSELRAMHTHRAKLAREPTSAEHSWCISEHE